MIGQGFVNVYIVMSEFCQYEDCSVLIYSYVNMCILISLRMCMLSIASGMQASPSQGYSGEYSCG